MRRRQVPVLTWNAWIGQGVQERRAELVQLLNDTGRPPFVVLNEVYDWPVGTVPGYYPVRAGVQAHPHRDARSTMMLVRRRGVDLRHTAARSAGGPHWTGPKHGLDHPPRVFVRAVARYDGQLWDVVGVHRTRAPWSRDGAAHEAEHDTLAGWSKTIELRHPGRPLAFVGDHNGPMDRLARAIGGTAVLRGPDGVVSRDCAPQRVTQLVDRYGSDHRPVMIQLATTS